ncbi:MAG TPA: UDP-glucose--hexose-1-phosphate uridylyltransferase [Steroidobacteraceae bacterium]|nr:UDP-glucose--hexose-1-phosphate uridylyltransferase [Steroidobacteraceae bacterium]
MEHRDRPHRRLNALTGEWVFVSSHRVNRPWHGLRDEARVGALPAYDPNCYLCPGNVRASGERNAPYTATYVWTNDFPAFLPETVTGVEASRHPLLRAHAHAGTCRVICYSPRHDLTLAQLPVREIRGVIDTWAAEIDELESAWRWVQVFENKGEIMGCSNPHPHGQIWASDFLPNEPAKELLQQRQWLAEHGSRLLLDYARHELAEGERLVTENAHWIVVVPWWAAWPFETLVLPRRHVPRLPGLDSMERDALAEILSRLLIAYDRLFGVSFPYSFGWHGAPAPAPADAEDPRRAWQLHAHFYPPLLRSATVRKFMVGYELLAEVQRDLTAEHAAERLRALATA